MSGAILSMRDLSVSFDGFKAVDGLDLVVERNELRCVIGPNGAGKTTLLDMVCGKTKPTRGSIIFKTLELTRMGEYEITRAGVGRKFQNPSVYEDLTVLENLEISYPEQRGVIGSLFFSDARQHCACASMKWRTRFICVTISTSRRACYHTDRSNGWKSACC